MVLESEPMKGVCTTTCRTFHEILGGNTRYLNELYWMIDVGQGNMNYFGIIGREDIYDSFETEIEDGGFIYKPGFIELFGEFIQQDEEAFYIGFPAKNPDEAISITKSLRGLLHHQLFFQYLRSIRGVLVYQDSEGHVYIFSDNTTLLSSICYSMPVDSGEIWTDTGTPYQFQNLETDK